MTEPKPEKMWAGCYQYRGRLVVRTSWDGARGGTKWRWETGYLDAYDRINIDGNISHLTRKEAMEDIDRDAKEQGEWKLVPAHMRDEGSRRGEGFCEGGEKYTKSGTCQFGCDHADHYSNDGHPECEAGADTVGLK